jgi:hypothetical protein
MKLNTFQQISEDNYRRLEEYIQRLREAKIKLPNRGGKVNKTAVATACGFNRSTFVQNKRFETLINDAVKELGLEVPAKATETDATDKRDKARVLVLEQQLAAVRSENYELRRKLARYEHAAATGRRVIA